MGERPILFSAPMVRAILDGRKTQTRRVVKLLGADCIEERAWETHFLQSPWPWSPQADEWLACPYGAPGDRLWVRETWAPHDTKKLAFYRADHPEWTTGDGGDVDRWRPSIHMPRWASRITLEVTGVRVERLNNISDADARAEGCPFDEPPAGKPWAWFRKLWMDINGADSWAANPWVWVVSFKRVEEVSRG